MADPKWQDVLADLGGKASGEKFRAVSLVADLLGKKLPGDALDPIKNKYREAGADYNDLLGTIASELIQNEKPDLQLFNPKITKSNTSYQAFFDAAQDAFDASGTKPFALTAKAEANVRNPMGFAALVDPGTVVTSLVGAVDLIFKHVEFFWKQHKDVKAAFASTLEKNQWPIWQKIEKDPASAMDAAPASQPDKGTAAGTN